MTVIERVTVVIVLHDSAATLKRCLAGALAQPEVAEIVLVDNASRDDWRSQLPADARIRSIVNADNRGFAAACNQGAALASSPYLLFLNPDCFLPAAALNGLLGGLTQVADVGLVGAQLLNADGSLQSATTRRTPTPGAALLGILRARAAGAMVNRDSQEIMPGWRRVDAISGALMLLRNTDFQRLGGFDEAYRLHCEDLDLCRRVLLGGQSIALCAQLQVTHLKGTSSRRRPLWIEWQKHRGMLRYFRKFDAAGSAWWLRLLVPLGIVAHFPLAVLRAIWRGRRGKGM